MKANELMIDDWVYRHDCYDQVKEISNNGIIGLDSLRGRIMFGELKPIPLTAQILEKNGFTIKEKWAQIGNFGDNPLIMWHFVDDPILRNYNTELEIHQNDTGKVHVRIPCEFVHELQHALRLAGIEKTIEL